MSPIGIDMPGGSWRSFWSEAGSLSDHEHQAGTDLWGCPVWVISPVSSCLWDRRKFIPSSSVSFPSIYSCPVSRAWYWLKVGSRPTRCTSQGTRGGLPEGQTLYKEATCLRHLMPYPSKLCIPVQASTSERSCWHESCCSRPRVGHIVLGFALVTWPKWTLE